MKKLLLLVYIIVLCGCRATYYDNGVTPNMFEYYEDYPDLMNHNLFCGFSPDIKQIKNIQMWHSNFTL